MTIELTDDELQTLTFAIALAIAIGVKSAVAVVPRTDLVALVNKLHRDDPHWIPYEVVADDAHPAS